MGSDASLLLASTKSKRGLISIAHTCLELLDLHSFLLPILWPSVQSTDYIASIEDLIACMVVLSLLWYQVLQWVSQTYTKPRMTVDPGKDSSLQC